MGDEDGRHFIVTEFVDGVTLRKHLAEEMGFVVPPVHIRDNLQLKPGEYAILLKGVEIQRAEIRLGQYLAINPGGADPSFRGVPTKSFDGRGNYTLGVRDQLIFPEIDYSKVEKTKGMNITIVTSAGSDDHARTLLKHMGMPFRQPGQ